MIDKEKLEKFIEKELDGTPYYLVELSVSPDNRIVAEIDSDGNVDIDECIRLTRAVEAEFPREDEDYELEVGSAGLTSPFRCERQYRKHIGDPVEVLSADGKKYRGELREATPEGFMIMSEEKVKHEGEKRPRTEEVEHRFEYDKVKYTKYIL